MKTLLLILTVISSHLVLADSNLEVCRGESGLFGFCSSEGEVVIQHQYYDAHEFIDGFAAVLVEYRWGIINEEGDLVVKPIFDDMISCENTDFTLVRQDTEWFFVNSKGEAITDGYDVAMPEEEFKFNGAVAEFSADTWFAVIKKGKWGAVNISNEVKLDFDYQWVKIIRQPSRSGETVTGVIVKDKRDMFAWQDPSGLYSSGFVFENFLGINEDRLFFLKAGGLVVLDANFGEEVAVKSSDYFVLTNDKNLTGVVNARIGRVVIPFIYESIDNVTIPNHAIIKTGYKVGLANMFGDILLKQEYEEIKLLSQNPLMVAVKNESNKVAIMAVDANNLRQLSTFKYKFAKPQGDNFYVAIGNKHGYVTMSGEEVWKN